MKDWRVFERLVAMLSGDQYDDSYTVIPNARIKGFISGRKRQIDVLVDYRYNSDLTKRIIIDAKNRARPVDIKEVESFEGLMKDTGAKRGFLVCTSGHTKAALKRAQDHISIKLIDPEQLADFDISSWDHCLSEDCENGLLLWDACPGVIIDGKVSVQATSKCDECGSFHVWCWDCGNKHVLGSEDQWQCACAGPWFWLTCIEPELDGGEYCNDAIYLLLVSGNGVPYLIDRRPL